MPQNGSWEIGAAYQSIYLKTYKKKTTKKKKTFYLKTFLRMKLTISLKRLLMNSLKKVFLEQIEEGFVDYISSESEVLNEARRAKRERR